MYLCPGVLISSAGITRSTYVTYRNHRMQRVLSAAIFKCRPFQVQWSLSAEIIKCTYFQVQMFLCAGTFKVSSSVGIPQNDKSGDRRKDHFGDPSRASPGAFPRPLSAEMSRCRNFHICHMGSFYFLFIFLGYHCNVIAMSYHIMLLWCCDVISPHCNVVSRHRTVISRRGNVILPFIRE